nr:PxKF domain-containing protein [Deltaproteobacteria bacterium]
STPTSKDQIDGVRPVNCVPASGSLFPVGTTQVTCTATDASGNTGTRTFPVTVVNLTPPTFDWSGILQPINADGSSVFKLSSVVPVKFKLVGASAGITNLVATLTVAKFSNNIFGSDQEASSPGQADAGNVFRYDPAADQYIFNLSTKPLSAGSWRLTIDLGDGIPHYVYISLKP